MSGEADRDLVRRVQTGDSTATGELYKRYWRAARAAGFAVTGEWAGAEDAASDGFCEALSGIKTLQDPSCFGSWLRTIVIRKARSGRKWSSWEVVPDCQDPGDRPDEQLARRELTEVLHEAVCHLPEALREVIALHYFEGYATADAAFFLDLPAGTFRRRLHDGRKRLRSSVEQILNGRKPMNEAQPPDIERLKSMITSGPIEQAMREIFALRPPPEELLDLLRKQRSASSDLEQMARRAASIIESVSNYASDPDHPVGAMALAIRRALPEFREWQLCLSASVTHLFAQGEYRDRLQGILPPGFAEGNPGAFVRATRGLVHVTMADRAETVHELLQRASGGRPQIRISDVLDLTWMAREPLELRSVQEMMERLSAAVLPKMQPRFSSYQEPRYRTAFQLNFVGIQDRAAVGGVLAEWPGRPIGIGAAFVRIFLEPWASAHTGTRIEFVGLPQASDHHPE